MMSSASPNDIQTSLKYIHTYVNDGVRPFNYGYPKEDGTQLKGGSQKQKDVVVRDARRLDRRFDQHAKELVEHKTSLSTAHFYDDEAKIKDVYYKEEEASASGADHVYKYNY
jgi:hypothetical protein